MTKPKYIIKTESNAFYSNSRNARKHLKEHNARVVYVHANDKEETLLCSAYRLCGCLLVGAVEK